jgi:pseudouridine kinase
MQRRGDKVKITVIGGVNVDITGRSIRPLKMADSNPAKVYLSAGGVGRNIAENLFRLGTDVLFMGAVGDDHFAEVLRGFFARAGMDGTGLITRKGMNTGLYLDLLEPSGDLFTAISDMDALESLGPADAALFAPRIVEADMAIFDANLKTEPLEALAETAGETPLMADSVSVAKAARLIPVLGRLAVLKTNRAEAEVLAGFPLDSDAALEEACAVFRARGIREVHITLGARGSCFAGSGGFGFQPALPGGKLSVNGAGDAFAAGTAYRYCRGGAAAENARFGAACAAITLESAEAVSAALSGEAAAARGGLDW